MENYTELAQYYANYAVAAYENGDMLAYVRDMVCCDPIYNNLNGEFTGEYELNPTLGGPTVYIFTADGEVRYHTQDGAGSVYLDTDITDELRRACDMINPELFL